MKKYTMWAILPLWVYGGTMLGFFLVAKLLELMANLGVSFQGVNENVLQLVFQAVSYVGALLVVIGVPYLFFRGKINKEKYAGCNADDSNYLGISVWIVNTRFMVYFF